MIKDYTAGISWKEKLFRAAIHVPAGVITALACQLGWVFGIVCFTGFSLYEINEDKHLHDKAFLDIFGYLVGLYVAVLVLYVLRLVK